MRPILYGASYSVYVQAARLAMEEKGVAYDQVEVDVFGPSGVGPDHLKRQPFGRIPAFEHDGFELYETGAITRYIDEAFEGPALQPAEPRARARMSQVISMLDSYAYRTLVWGIYVESVEAPARGRARDQAGIAAQLPKATACLKALADLADGHPWLAGPAMTLADLHAAPMFALFLQAPEAAPLMAPHPGLFGWWARISARPSVRRLLSLDRIADA